MPFPRIHITDINTNERITVIPFRELTPNLISFSQLFKDTAHNTKSKGNSNHNGPRVQFFTIPENSPLFSFLTKKVIHKQIIDRPCLIGKTEEDKSLHIIQQVSQNVWALCKVDKNLKINEINTLVSKEEQSDTVNSIPSNSNELNSISSSVDMSNFTIEDLSSLSSMEMVDFDLQSNDSSTEFSMSPPSSSNNKKKSLPSNLSTSSSTSPSPTEKDILIALKKKYYDALYLGSTPLVFFVKSTLSKIRILYDSISPATEEKPFLNLILTQDTLSKLILSIVEFDKKYSGTNLYKSTQIDELESDYLKKWRNKVFDDLASTVNGGMNIIESKKKEINKNIEVKIEDDADKESSPNNANNHVFLKRKLDILKAREVKLQIILLLEVLTLKQELPLDVTSKETNGHKQFKRQLVSNRKLKRKRKSKHDLEKIDLNEDKEPSKEMDYSTLINLYVDRACILEAINQITTIDKNITESKLQEFCYELVMPFYGSKLAKQTQLIIEKCTGIIPRPPRKSKSSSRLETRPRSKSVATEHKSKRNSLVSNSKLKHEESSQNLNSLLEQDKKRRSFHRQSSVLAFDPSEIEEDQPAVTKPLSRLKKEGFNRSRSLILPSRHKYTHEKEEDSHNNDPKDHKSTDRVPKHKLKRTLSTARSFSSSLQRRQVDVTFSASSLKSETSTTTSSSVYKQSSKHHQPGSRLSVEEELVNAIKQISKPHRTTLAEELADQKEQREILTASKRRKITSHKRSNVINSHSQVTETPSKPSRHQTFFSKNYKAPSLSFSKTSYALPLPPLPTPANSSDNRNATSNEDIDTKGVKTNVFQTPQKKQILPMASCEIDSSPILLDTPLGKNPKINLSGSNERRWTRKDEENLGEIFSSSP